jgi:hypothetical protein
MKMVIKKECMIKSLKSDYKIIGPIILIGIAVIGFFYCMVVYGSQFNYLLSTFTAVNAFMFFECIAMLMIPTLIVLNSDAGSVRESSNTPLLIFINSILMGFVYMIYVSASETHPNMSIVFIILELIDALIVAPITIAYVRCRE